MPNALKALRTRGSALAVMLVAALTLGVLAGIAPAAATSASADTELATVTGFEGQIFGSVRNVPGSKPVPNARPLFYNADLPESAGGALGGYSGADGHYTSPNLPPGRYKIGFWGLQGQRSFYPIGSDFDQATVLELTAGSVITVNGHIPVDDATISGTATLRKGASGDPQPGVQVFVTPYRGGIELAGEWTDANGAYTIKGLSAGYYTLSFETYPPYIREYYSDSTDAYDHADATTIVVAADTDHAGIDVELSDVQQFTSTSGPVLSAESVVGQTVTASVADWAPTGAQFSYQWNRSGTPIAGATTANYVIAEPDLGSILTLTVTGTKDGYVAVSLTSAPSATISGAWASTPTPVVSGTATVGQTLNADAGTWVPAATLSYQWMRSGVKISGATSSSYTLEAADAGQEITVVVTGEKSNYASVSQTSLSALTSTGVFTTAPTPIVSGTATVGQTLKATAGIWSPAATLSYQWMRNGVAIKAATASTYTLTSSDTGQKITVTVTAQKAGYTTASKTSSATGAVVGVFTTAPTPKLSGTARVGQTLKATAGTWSPAATLGYQWMRSGAKISGATSSSYRLTSADLGKVITVVVTGKKSGYLTAAKTSAASSVVQQVFTSAPTPKLAGTAVTGQTLKASAGTWSPAATLSYQWKRAGVAIAGATGTTYVVKPGDVDGTLSVTVTAKRANYVTTAKSSTATKAIVGLKYANCAALNKAYPSGVAKPGTRYDKVNGVNKPIKGKPFFSAALYALNAKSDGDKDGIACNG